MNLNLASSTVLAVLFVPVVLFIGRFVYQWKQRWSKLVAMMDKIPGVKPHFLFGNLLDVKAPRIEMFAKGQQFLERFPDKPLIGIWIGPTDPHVTLKKAEAVEVLLSSHQDLHKSHFYDYIHPWVGHGLLTSGGARWHAMRKILTPSFHFKILDNFVEVFNEQARILISKLECHADDGKPFTIDAPVSLCTLDIICETAMQKKINAQSDSESSYVRAVHEASDIISRRFLQPWYGSDWLFAISPPGRRLAKHLKILHDFTDNVIAERRKSQQADKSSSHNADAGSEVYGQKRRRAFLDTLLEYSENGHTLSDKRIREEVDTFMFEGHDTTSSGICWTVYLLGLYPAVQDKVVNELRSVLGDSDRSLTSSDLKELKYLECVIKESLRLYPPVPIFSRRLKQETQMGGYTIPGGLTVAVHVYMLHRDPKYFPDPEAFDPDRFLQENISQRSPYSYVPFSAGPRNCIGQKYALMEEKIVLAHLLRRYRVTSMETREDIKLVLELILRPANGTLIKLEKRTDFQQQKANINPLCTA